MPLPLAGLLVVSLEQAVAAPMCTCRLADTGARVIKIERPEGDFARYYDKLAVPRAAMNPVATGSKRAAPASPPPFTGEGQGGGTQKDSCVRAPAPPPPPPPPRGGRGAARDRGGGRRATPQ